MATKTNPSSIMTWSALIAGLSSMASVAGLTDAAVYAQETQNWISQAKGQDIGNLIAVAVLIVSGYLYARGSLKAALVWLGTLLYFVYAYAVYAFALHFNYLFLIYVAVLGLSVYAIVFNLGRMRSMSAKYAGAFKHAAYTLIGIGSLFGLLWLSEVIPAIAGGTVPKSLQEAGLWVNPIHVIDLALVLPAFIITGVMMLRGSKAGQFFAAPWLAFSVLMGTSIVAATILMNTPDALPPMIMVSIVVAASLAALWRYIQAIRSS